MAPPIDLTILHVICVYELRASDERTAPEAESIAEAVVWKRAIDVERLSYVETSGNCIIS